MKVVAIIQARVDSTRLPDKVLLKLNGKRVIEHVIDRVKNGKKIDQVVVATSDSPKDDELVKVLKKLNIDYFRGSGHDVLERYYLAAKKFGADVIVRVCSDCPLLDPGGMDFVIESHLKENADYTTSKHDKGWPDGTGTEVVDFEALKKSNESAHKNYDREHVTTFIKNNKSIFKIHTVDAPKNIFRPNLHLALDTKKDLIYLKEIYKELYKGGAIGLADVIKFLDKCPKI